MNFKKSLSVLLIPALLVTGGVYNISLPTIDGNAITLANYQGKTIIATEFDAGNPDLKELTFLDSLQQNDTSVEVIAVPAIDFSGRVSLASIKKMRDTLGLKMVITLPSGVKRINRSGQNPLFEWLTNSKENSHFDVDISAPGQIFIINNTGTLYSQLTKDTPKQVVLDAIKQQINQ